MPVTIKPASHDASTTPVKKLTQDTHGLLKQAYPEGSQEPEQILQTSFAHANPKDSNVCSSTNGFVCTAIEAYDKHYHLTIRPDDVWFAILSQLSVYITANAKESRGKFVSHEGKEDLTVDEHHGDCEKFAEESARGIEKNVTNPELRKWIMPAFTTTTATDAILASIPITGDFSKRVDVIDRYECGLSSVTLLGEMSDWKELYRKLDKLEAFGVEPAQFGCLLKPVISRFIESFHDPTSKNVVQFWGDMISDEFSGSAKYDGWITAFCFWSEQGENFNDRHMQFRGGRGYNLDGMVYHTIDSEDIHASVPVKLNNWNELATIMLPGSIGTQHTSSNGTSTESDVDSETSVSGWGMSTEKEVVEETGEISKAGPGNSAEDTEPTNSTSNQGSATLPEDSPSPNPSPVAAASAKKPGLMSRLANLFSRTEISKER